MSARLHSLEFLLIDAPLLEPFGIATGAHLSLENVLVRLTLEDGTVGLGEAAPAPHISGETRGQVLEAKARVESALERLDLAAYREVSEALGDVLAPVPSARAGVETALLDALCRRAGISMLAWFGARERELWTDITVTTGTAEHAARSSARAAAQGFRSLKVKIGGGTLESDVERLRAIATAAPTAELLLDGNTAFSVESALQLLDELGPIRERVKLFEQPVPREDVEGLAEVEARGRVPVAADESLRSREDFARIVQTGGISVVNIKTAKLGLVQAHDLLVAARALGQDVMIGGMLETELSMTASACLAAGVGGVRYVDLDTPLFLGPRPLRGGFVQSGPHLDLGGITSGHGVTFVP